MPFAAELLYCSPLDIGLMWEKLPFQIGDVVPGPWDQTFRVIRCIAEGGFSVVFEIVSEQTGLHWALKALRMKHAANAKTAKRQMREGQVLYSLQHPNLVRVYHIGLRKEDQLIYMVMDLLVGRTLRELQYDLTVQGPSNSVAGRVPMVWALEIMRSVCNALEAVHVYAVHRDLKPENVHIGDDGIVHLFDLGSSYFPREARLTSRNVTIGTVQYMSPEQLEKPDQLDARSDLFSAGTMLYELLSGRLPFSLDTGEGDQTRALGFKIILGTHIPLHEVAPHVPPVVADIVEKLLHKNASQRYSSAKVLSTFLGAAYDEVLLPFGQNAPATLATCIQTISRASLVVEPPARLSFPASHNPYVTLSLPPDQPKQGVDLLSPAAEVLSARLSAVSVPTQSVVTADRLPFLEVSGDRAATLPLAHTEGSAPSAAASPPATTSPPVPWSDPTSLAYARTEEIDAAAFAKALKAPVLRESVGDSVPAPVQAPDVSREALSDLRTSPAYKPSRQETLAMIQALPDDLRDPFVLRYAHKRPIEEVAVALNLPVVIADQRANAGFKRFAAILEEMERSIAEGSAGIALSGASIDSAVGAAIEAENDVEARNQLLEMVRVSCGLPDDVRGPFLLTHLCGKSIAEAAASLGLSRETVTERTLEGRAHFIRICDEEARATEPSTGHTVSTPVFAPVVTGMREPEAGIQRLVRRPGVTRFAAAAAVVTATALVVASLGAAVGALILQTPTALVAQSPPYASERPTETSPIASTPTPASTGTATPPSLSPVADAALPAPNEARAPSAALPPPASPRVVRPARLAATVPTSHASVDTSSHPSSPAVTAPSAASHRLFLVEE